MIRRRTYTGEFKESAIELYHSRGGAMKDIANELGISADNLRRWIREKEDGEENNIKTFPGQGNPRDEELFQLRKKVADLQETNEILKKAMAIFTIKTPR